MTGFYMKYKSNDWFLYEMQQWPEMGQAEYFDSQFGEI